MTRRCDEVVQVAHQAGRPVAFRWRRRRYVVRAVLAHWVEATAWWQGLAAGSSGSRSQTREVWRVEAVSRAGTTGVVDLAVVAERWRLVRVID